jgi:hypothetical protein
MGGTALTFIIISKFRPYSFIIQPFQNTAINLSSHISHPTYGIQLWGTASTSNIEILERFHSKALRMIVGTPWYVTNTVIRTYRKIPTVKKEILRYSSQYSARLSAHPNDLIVNLIELPDNRRFQGHLPNDLPTRFLV